MKKLHIRLTCAKWAMKDKQSGLTTVEYAVAGALVSAAVVLAFTNLGTAVDSVIDELKNAID